MSRDSSKYSDTVCSCIIWKSKVKTRPVARQDSTPDIAHFVSRKF